MSNIGITRRNLVKGAAWTAPAVMVSSVVPAYAASGDSCPVVSSVVEKNPADANQFVTTFTVSGGEFSDLANSFSVALFGSVQLPNVSDFYSEMTLEPIEFDSNWDFTPDPTLHGYRLLWVGESEPTGTFRIVWSLPAKDQFASEIEGSQYTTDDLIYGENTAFNWGYGEECGQLPPYASGVRE